VTQWFVQMYSATLSVCHIYRHYLHVNGLQYHLLVTLNRPEEVIMTIFMMKTSAQYFLKGCLIECHSSQLVVNAFSKQLYKETVIVPRTGS